MNLGLGMAIVAASAVHGTFMAITHHAVSVAMHRRMERVLLRKRLQEIAHQYGVPFFRKDTFETLKARVEEKHNAECGECKRDVMQSRAN